MYDVTVPCSIFFFLFIFSFICMCWFYKHRYIKPLERRVAWLEYQIEEPVTKPIPQQRRAYTTTTTIRHVPVDREPVEN